uniref:Dynein light chain n=1 Tax=Panagrolaimus sp. JU765 TaxID=591449 RepID=A0AC34QJG2_9BILA
MGAEKKKKNKEKKNIVLIGDERVDLDSLKFKTKFKVSVKSSEMPVEMIEKAVTLADEIMQKTTDDGEIAEYIKQGFNALYSPPWHCIVGRKYSSLITHDSGYFVYFFISKLACVIFKARD